MPEAKYTTAEELAHPAPESAKIDGRQRYTSAKLVNVMWTYALHRRFTHIPEKHLTVICACPGLMPGTGLAREYPAWLKFLWLHFLPHIIPVMRILIDGNIWLPKDSGATLARLVMGDDASGVYYSSGKPIKSSVASYDEAKQEELWEWTLKNISESEEERVKFDIGK